MNILTIGPNPQDPRDGVIIKGIYYLLNKAYPGATIEHFILSDTTNYTSHSLVFKYDLLVVCGTPWIWDAFQNSPKYKNLQILFNTHQKAKKLFMGVGSCLYLRDVATNICRRPEEKQGIRDLFTRGTVIVRDHLAKELLDEAYVESTFLPCPAYFCYGDEAVQPNKEGAVLVFQDPTISISSGMWRDSAVLQKYTDEVMEFYNKYSPAVYCAWDMEIALAERIGLPTPMVLQSPDDTLNVMRKAKRVLSGRVHCAVPAIVQGADVKLMPIDSRHYVVSDFPSIQISNYYDAYIKILHSVFEPRPVSGESKRVHSKRIISGFYEKYMQGSNGLDIGYAGYSGGLPILPSAIGVDKDFPGYDGIKLPFPDNSQDYTYSSHCLEHISSFTAALQEWFRVIKINGHIVITVPHKFLYERKHSLPSKWNEDHKRFYTPASLLKEIEESLEPNTYRVRLLEDGDDQYNYNKTPEVHASGQYEITLVLQKINPPDWKFI